MRRFIWRGYCATHPPIAQLLQVESHRSLLLHPTFVECLCRCLSTIHRGIFRTWIAGSAGPMRGCYVRGSVAGAVQVKLEDVFRSSAAAIERIGRALVDRPAARPGSDALQTAVQ
jgi:hypothetical protein